MTGFIKIWLLLTTGLLSYNKACAQDLRFDLGLSYPQPASGPMHVAAAGLYLEPNVILQDHYSIGLHLSGGAAAQLETSQAEVNGSQLTYFSGMLISDYYLGSSSFKPYTGLGIGYILYARNFKDANNSFTQASAGLGFAFRLGFTFKALDVGLEYSIATGSRQEATVVSGGKQIKPHFWGIKLGCIIGRDKS